MDGTCNARERLNMVTFLSKCMKEEMTGERKIEDILMLRVGLDWTGSEQGKRVKFFSKDLKTLLTCYCNLLLRIFYFFVYL